MLPVCSGDQSPQYFLHVLFYNFFWEHVPIKEKLAGRKTHVIFSYFDSNTSVYRPNHALKCRITVKKINSTNTWCTIALSGAPVLIGVTSINVDCISWRDFDVNGKLFILA